MPGSGEAQNALKELMGDRLGEGSRVAASLRGAALEKLKIGKNAIVGAASVVTKDVPDYAVVVGNPAKAIRMLDAGRCEAQKG